MFCNMQFKNSLLHKIKKKKKKRGVPVLAQWVKNMTAVA